MSQVGRTGDRVRVVLSVQEALVVRQLVTHVRDLLAPPAPPAHPADPSGAPDAGGAAEPGGAAERGRRDDALADAFGTFGSFGPDRPPQDPVLARLLPDGYRDDPDAAAELRRFTEPSLRQEKSETAARLLDSLPERGGAVRLDLETARAWLGALNDVRLSLGTRLGVTQSTSDEFAAGHYDGDDPVSVAHQVYVWLSQFQELLVTAVMDPGD